MGQVGQARAGRAGPGAGDSPTASPWRASWKADVLDHGEEREQVVGLVDEADVGASELAASPLRERGDHRRADPHHARGRDGEAAQEAEQGRLAAPAGPDDGHAGPGVDGEGDVVQARGPGPRAVAYSTTRRLDLDRGSMVTRARPGASTRRSRALGPAGEPLVVGHEQHGQAALAGGREDERGHRRRGGGVELADDLVGQQQAPARWPGPRPPPPVAPPRRTAGAAGGRRRSPSPSLDEQRSGPPADPPPGANPMASSTFSRAVRNGMRLSDCSTTPIRVGAEPGPRRRRPASSVRCPSI